MHLKSKDLFHVPVNKNRFPASEGHQISQVSSSDQVPMQQMYISTHFMRVLWKNNLDIMEKWQKGWKIRFSPFAQLKKFTFNSE